MHLGMCLPSRLLQIRAALLSLVRLPQSALLPKLLDRVALLILMYR